MATFFLPGLVWSFVFLSKKNVSLSELFSYIIIFGLISQIIIGVEIVLLDAFNLSMPLLQKTILGAFVVLITTLLSLLWRIRRQGQIAKIVPTSLDVALILLIFILLSLLSKSFQSTLIHKYYNPAADQYYWMATAERFLYTPQLIFSHNFYNLDIPKSTFFLFLSPYIAFLPKDFNVYQQFILTWTYFCYALLAFTITRLAITLLPGASLGLLAAPILLSFHWNNYYIISNSVSQQNLALPLVLLGLIFFRTHPPWFKLLMALLLYLVHLPSLVLLFLVLGVVDIGQRLFKFLKTRSLLNLVIGMSFIDALVIIFTLIVFVRYIFVLVGFVHFGPDNVGDYGDYIKPQSLFNQPYIESSQFPIIWSAIIGFVMIIIGSFFNKKFTTALPLATGFGLYWFFLYKPLWPYYVFSASWQPFRYYLFVSPLLSILAIFPIAIIAQKIKLHFPFQLGSLIIFLILIALLPGLLLDSVRMQSMVILDMITGRDGGIFYQKIRLLVEELVLIAKQENTSQKPVILFSGMHAPWSLWIFSPRALYTTDQNCSEYYTCQVFDRVTGISSTSETSGANLAIFLKTEEIKQNKNKISKTLGNYQETFSFALFKKP